MSSSSTYFSQMLQRMIFEAHGVIKPPSPSVFTKNTNRPRQTPSPIVDRQEQKKRNNLEQKILRLKMFKDKPGKGLLERVVRSEERDTSSAEDSDDVDVVGGVGPTASQFNGDLEVIEEYFPPPDNPKRPNILKPTLECDTCGKAFTSPFQLKEHVSIQHLNERNFACDRCDQKFGRRGGLRRHIQMVHQNHLHKCPYAECNHPGYKCSKALTAHIRSVHTNVRPFVCEECQKAFVRKNDLKMHQMTHQKGSSFGCACGTTFRRQIYLRKHQKTCYAAGEATHGFTTKSSLAFLESGRTASKHTTSLSSSFSKDDVLEEEEEDEVDVVHGTPTSRVRRVIFPMNP